MFRWWGSVWPGVGQGGAGLIGQAEGHAQLLLGGPFGSEGQSVVGHDVTLAPDGQVNPKGFGLARRAEQAHQAAVARHQWAGPAGWLGVELAGNQFEGRQELRGQGFGDELAFFAGCHQAGGLHHDRQGVSPVTLRSAITSQPGRPRTYRQPGRQEDQSRGDVVASGHGECPVRAGIQNIKRHCRGHG